MTSAKGRGSATRALQATLMPRSIESLDTVSRASDDTDDYEEERRAIQEEWEESIQQLQLITSMVLFPFLGKWLGRRTSMICMYFPIALILFSFETV
jgi:uncharacterized membrane protein YoaK (UPF0700 family)